MANSRLKIALMGCGGIAQAHWQGIQRIATRVDVTAVVDKNPEMANAMSEQTGAKAFTDIEEALEMGDFDAVDIMLPHDLHESAALACFGAGKHVLLEKPMAHSLESAERILEASDKVDTVFMIAEQAQYWTDIVKARELMDAGAIGDVISDLARQTLSRPADKGFQKDGARRSGLPQLPVKASGGVVDLERVNQLRDEEA